MLVLVYQYMGDHRHTPVLLYASANGLSTFKYSTKFIVFVAVTSFYKLLLKFINFLLKSQMGVASKSLDYVIVHKLINK